MSAKRLRLRRELRAKLDFEEAMRDAAREILADDFPADGTWQEEGRALIPRPDAGGAGNDARPADSRLPQMDPDGH